LIQFLQVQKEKLGYSMDPELVARTLNFHGQQLTKLWESEHGTPAVRDLDYEEFSKRSKDLGFQDRAKRIKLHQFMVDKASSLFKSEKNSKDAKTFAFETNDEGNIQLKLAGIFSNIPILYRLLSYGSTIRVFHQT